MLPTLLPNSPNGLLLNREQTVRCGLAKDELHISLWTLIWCCGLRTFLMAKLILMDSAEMFGVFSGGIMPCISFILISPTTEYSSYDSMDMYCIRKDVLG